MDPGSLTHACADCNEMLPRLEELCKNVVAAGQVGWIGLDWIGLDWIGLDWIGFDLIGLDLI